MTTPPVIVARHAMATRFEIALFGDRPAALRGAAEEALDEVQRVERLLNWRQPSSPLARVNAHAYRAPVTVNAELFALLKRCREFHELSGGAFDITIGPLVRALEARANQPGTLPADAFAAARQACGMAHVELDEAASSVRFARAGTQLDFGAVGKGYALELAADVLRDAGVTTALIHGGTSTVCALGHPPGETGWKIAVEYPPGAAATEPPPVLAVIELRDEAMSVSAVWGRTYRIGENRFGHVIDPRTGTPADRALLSIFISANATETDALSTALLTDGPAGIELLKQRRPDARTLVLARDAAGGFAASSHGITAQPHPCDTSTIANQAQAS